MKRLLYLLLAVVLIAACLFSCSLLKKQSDPSSGEDDPVSQIEQETPAQEEQIAEIGYGHSDGGDYRRKRVEAFSDDQIGEVHFAEERVRRGKELPVCGRHLHDRVRRIPVEIPPEPRRSRHGELPADPRVKSGGG